MTRDSLKAVVSKSNYITVYYVDIIIIIITKPFLNNRIVKFISIQIYYNIMTNSFSLKEAAAKAEMEDLRRAMPLIPQALAELRANPENHKLGKH